MIRPCVSSTPLSKTAMPIPVPVSPPLTRLRTCSAPIGSSTNPEAEIGRSGLTYATLPSAANWRMAVRGASIVTKPMPVIFCLIRPPNAASFSWKTTLGVVLSSCTMKLCCSSTPTADEGSNAPLMRSRVSSASASVFGRSRVCACRSWRTWASVLPVIAWRASSSSCARISSRSGASFGFCCCLLCRAACSVCPCGAVLKAVSGRLKIIVRLNAVNFFIFFPLA